MFFLGCVTGAVVFGIAEVACLRAVCIIIKYFEEDNNK